MSFISYFLIIFYSNFQALEEEVEGLKSELREAEASNDEINEELQMLQEQLLSSR